MQSLQGCLCRTSQSHLLAKKFVITEMGSNYTKWGNPLVPRKAISIHQGDQAAIQGVTGQTKINNLLYAYISIQGCKMTEPGMVNIYWSKIKLRAAAIQAIYLVIFHWVVRSLYDFVY